MAEASEASNFLHHWSSSSHHLQNNPVLEMGPNQQNPCFNIEDHGDCNHEQAVLLRKKQQQQQQRKGKRSGKASQKQQKVAQRGLGVEKLERMRAEQEGMMIKSPNKRCQKIEDQHVVLLHPANQLQHHHPQQFQYHPFPHLLDHHHRPHHYQNGFSSPVHPVVPAAVHPHQSVNYCGSVVMNKDVADYGHQMNFVRQNFNTYGNGGGFVNGPPADRVLVNNPCMFSGPQEQQLQYYPADHQKELSSTQMMHCFPQQQQQQCDFPVHHQMYPNYPNPNPMIKYNCDEQKPKLREKTEMINTHDDQSLELSLGRKRNNGNHGKNNTDVVNGKQGRELRLGQPDTVDEGEEVEVVAIHRRSKALGGVRKSILMEYQFFPGKNDSNNNSSSSSSTSATCGGGDLVDLSLKLSL